MNTRSTRAEVAYYAAQETALASPDVFGDWFGAELNGAQAELELPAQIRDEVTAEDFAQTPVPRLYMLMIDCGQSDRVRLAAVNAIAERYLSAKEDFVQSLVENRWGIAA